MTRLIFLSGLVACIVSGGVATRGSLRFKEQLASAPKSAPISQVAVEFKVAAPAAAAPAPTFPGDRYYDEDAYVKESWAKEWKNGNFPGYKITNPLAVKFEDYQSD